jgi:hypothetical protein
MKEKEVEEMRKNIRSTSIDLQKRETKADHIVIERRTNQKSSVISIVQVLLREIHLQALPDLGQEIEIEEMKSLKEKVSLT